MVNKKVLVSGCFVGCHAGHILLLQEASKLGDVYVALNSDEYIERVKGKEKLIDNWKTRAQKIYSYGLAKYIYFFNDDTPQKIALELKPDYIVVGSDHNDKDMGWALEVINQWDGKIVYVNRLKDENGIDISTTNILLKEKLEKIIEEDGQKILKDVLNKLSDFVVDKYIEEFNRKNNYE